jgi:hypothetical protein
MIESTVDGLLHDGSPPKEKGTQTSFLGMSEERGRPDRRSHTDSVSVYLSNRYDLVLLYKFECTGVLYYWQPVWIRVFYQYTILSSLPGTQY